MYSALLKLLYDVTHMLHSPFPSYPVGVKEPQKCTGLQVTIKGIMCVGKGIERKLNLSQHIPLRELYAAAMFASVFLISYYPANIVFLISYYAANIGLVSV